MKNLIAFIFIGLLNFSYTQTSYNVTELETTKGKTRGSSFVGIDESGFIYTTSYKSTYIVVGMLVRSYLKVFSATSGEMYAEVPLEKSKDLKRLGMEYISFEFINKKPTIICKKRKAEKPEDYYGIHINERGKIEGNPFKIGASGDCSGFMKRGKSFYSGVYYEKSNDGSFTFISDVSCNGDDLKTYRVLDLDENMEEENSYTFKLDFESVSNLSFLNSGDYMYLKADTREREKVDGKLFKRTIVTHRLYKISRKDGDLTEIEVEESFEPLKIGDFRMKSVSNGVLLSGQIIQEKGFAGLFTAIIEERTDEIIDIQTEDFDIDFVTKYWSDRQKRKKERKRNRKGEDENDENFSTNFQLMETFETSDNGLISVFQEFILRVVTRTSTDANGNMTTTTDYYYYYKDVIIVKTKEDGTIEYTEILPFYQLTVNYDPGKGYSAIKNGNDIYFLHGTSNEMEEMIEEGKKSRKKSRRKDRAIQYISITHLNESGDVDTETVLDLKEYPVSTDPNNVAEDKKNKQFVIVSPVTKMFKRKRTKVIRIEI
jgi:hypothetical protein